MSDKLLDISFKNTLFDTKCLINSLFLLRSQRIVLNLKSISTDQIQYPKD